jgi:hypothetical protein
MSKGLIAAMAALVVVAAGVAAQLPELRRYMKIKSM